VELPYNNVILKIGDSLDIDDRIGNRWIRRKLAHAVISLPYGPTSIIMLTKDCLDYTRKCLDSLAYYTRNFELIVIDNGSDKETVDYLKNLKRFKEYQLVLNTKNMGVPYGWNQGIKLAKYDYIAFINNDTLFTPDWLNQLQKCFSDNQLCGVASPTTCFTNGIQCDWELAPRRFEMTQLDINAYAQTLKYEYQEAEIYGFCFLTHKKVIDKIGVFDYKRYGMGSSEEKDFNWRARQSGFKTYWVKHCYVHHYGHVTFDKGNVNLDAEKQCILNQKKFAERIKDTAPNNLFIDNEVNVTPTILTMEFSPVIDVIIPTLDRQEETIRTLNALFENNTNNSINVIIVDNGSDDLSYLKQFNKKSLQIIKNKTNLGVIKALNQGLEIAKSKYIVTMHNDVIITTKDWIAKAIKYMEHDSNKDISNNGTVGMIGMAGWQEVKATGEYLPENLVTSIIKYNKKPKGDFQEVVITDGCCNVIKNIGLTYDENYGLTHFYDTDISLQYKILGYDNFVMSVDIEHIAENRTLSTVESPKYKVLTNKKDMLYYKERQKIFTDKWRSYLPFNLAPIPIKMITWDRLEYTKKAIKSILDNNDYPFILWIYDNNSTDGTQSYLRSLTDPRLQITYSKENTGLVPPFNIFLNQFKDSKYVCQVDNDCIMPKGWLSKFKYTMDNLPIFSLSGDHFLGIPYKIKTNKEFYDRLETVNFLGDNIYLFSHAGMGNMVRRQWIDKPIEVVDGTLGGWVRYQTTKWWAENRTCAFHSGVWINLLDMVATNTTGGIYGDYRNKTNMMRTGTSNGTGFGTIPLNLKELVLIRNRVKERWFTQIENTNISWAQEDLMESKKIKPVKLDLGCGPYRKDGYTGIDKFDWRDKYEDSEFIQGEIPNILKTFADDSVDEIQATHFIEHISQSRVIEFMNEVHRILKVGAIFEIKVPPSTGRGAYCDPTHISFWNDMSFRYYDKLWAPDLTESYGITANFEIVSNRVIDEFNLHVTLKKRSNS
jgi:GT2 family glycosyltransferase